MKEKPPVLVVILDTMRADFLDHPDLHSALPTLNKLLQESIVFTRAYSPSHWTLPSHASLFTGIAPVENEAVPPQLRLRDDVPTIAEVYRRQGYTTRCVTCNPFLSERFGMTRGFDFVWSPPIRPATFGFRFAVDLLSRVSTQFGRVSTVARNVTELATGAIRSSPRADNGLKAALSYAARVFQENGTAHFVVMNFMEAHDPYHGRGDFSTLRSRIKLADIFARWDRLRFSVMSGRRTLDENERKAVHQIYWSNVRYMDAELGSFLEQLPSHILDEGFLVVVSDHGQGLGDNGRLDHITGLGEDLIHVPLIVRPPGGVPQQRLSFPIEITRLFSLLESIPSDPTNAVSGFIGQSKEHHAVVSIAFGQMVPYVWRLKGRDPVTASDLLSFSADNSHPAVACVANGWKLICHLGRRDDELYHLDVDPLEQGDVATQGGDQLEALHQELKRRILSRSPRTSREALPDSLPLVAKREISTIVLRNALTLGRRPVLVWTGGKDSTIALHLAQGLVRREGMEMPPLLFINHGQHFDETHSFVGEIVEKEGLTLVVAENERLLRAMHGGAATISIDQLDSENQEEVLRAGFTGSEIPLNLKTAVGNHLLKTVPLSRSILEHGFDMVITGIRWDENPARAVEVFFSHRENPEHTRVHPILHWTEREVWRYTLDNDLPVHPLYKRGFRSFDGVRDSLPTDAKPAWEQDLSGSPERAGRAQDKEHIMQRLRELGYF